MKIEQAIICAELKSNFYDRKEELDITGHHWFADISRNKNSSTGRI